MLSDGPGMSTLDVAPLGSQKSFVPSDEAFERLRQLLYEKTGIALRDDKITLVQSRLSSRLRQRELASFEEYLDLIEAPGEDEELRLFVDLLTTNKTSFFRGPDHFELIQSALGDQWRDAKSFTAWSAGCSTGEEPYSLAMVLEEALGLRPAMQARVLATDISSRALAQAREGVYSDAVVQDVPQRYRSRHLFERRGEKPGAPSWEVSAELKSLVSFSHLNLMSAWPMQGPFDVILCRNVMIYFDRETRIRLVNRFVELLRPGGFLLIGHSETIEQSIEGLRCVRPATFVREARKGRAAR